MSKILDFHILTAAVPRITDILWECGFALIATFKCLVGIDTFVEYFGEAAYK